MANDSASLPKDTKYIGLMVFDGVQLLDIAGPVDVFAEANRQSGKVLYHVSLLAVLPKEPKNAFIKTASGVNLAPDLWLSASMTSEEITQKIKGMDYFLVAGGPQFLALSDQERQNPEYQEIYAVIRSIAQHMPVFGSICTGAVLLAEAGLLQNRRFTTHWAAIAWFRKHYPEAKIMEDALYCQDGPLWTAAGVTAGLDMALALVEADFGAELARKLAAYLVMFFRRSGGQKQFFRSDAAFPLMLKGKATMRSHSLLQESQRFILNNLTADMRVENLAKRVGLSKRHFSRLFVQETGQTPALWVEKIRIDAARALLDAGHPPKSVAASCGFSDHDTFRRAFLRQLGISPADYRKKNII